MSIGITFHEYQTQTMLLDAQAIRSFLDNASRGLLSLSEIQEQADDIRARMEYVIDVSSQRARVADQKAKRHLRHGGLPENFGTCEVCKSK